MLVFHISFVISNFRKFGQIVKNAKDKPCEISCYTVFAKCITFSNVRTIRYVTSKFNGAEREFMSPGKQIDTALY